MDVLGDLVHRDRRSDATALRAPAVGRSYDLRRFCTTAWKVGNFLPHLGVRAGSIVGIADDPVPESVLTLYGAGLLGAVARFETPAATTNPDDLRALVVPSVDLDEYEVVPRTKCVVYGDAPGNPNVSYFEREVWSENPTMPPVSVSPGDPLLETTEGRFTHADLLAAGKNVIEALDITPGDEVAVRGSFSVPGIVAAGLVAPVMAGASAILGRTSEGDYVVGGDDSDVNVEAIFEK